MMIPPGRHRFAGKKRKMRTFFIIILSAAGLVCQAQESCIGADIAAAARCGSLHVMLGHAFGEKWSAGADAELDFSLIRKKMSAEEAGHDGELGSLAWPSGKASYSFGASARYWPRQTFQGAFISAGMSWSESLGLDLCAGAGYMIRIWNGLAAGMAYEMNILETYRYGASGDEIKISLHYIF